LPEGGKAGFQTRSAMAGDFFPAAAGRDTNDERKIRRRGATMKSKPGNSGLRPRRQWLRSKTAICLLASALFVLWILDTPVNKPPGNHFQIQLDEKYLPVASRTIFQKTRSESWIIRAERGWFGSRGMISWRPQRIEIRCKSPVKATLFDLSHISGKELVALNTHPDARRDGVIPKPLDEYPVLARCEGQVQADWRLNRWPLNWGRCQYRLVVECPGNPNAIVDVWVHYGGTRFDESH
jgi:hypothetical protein